MLHGRLPVGPEMAIGHEVLGLAVAAEAQPFELHEQNRGERVVDHGDVEVAPTDLRPIEELRGQGPGTVHHGEIWSVVVGGDLFFEQGGARRPSDRDGCPRVLRTVGAGDDEGDCAVRLLATVEQADARFGDPARVLGDPRG